jgi:hypothetical protein
MNIASSNLHLALRMIGGRRCIFGESRKAFGLHPVNAGLRAGDYRERHTTVCGGNLKDPARWLTGAL